MSLLTYFACQSVSNALDKGANLLMFSVFSVPPW